MKNVMRFVKLFPIRKYFEIEKFYYLIQRKDRLNSKCIICLEEFQKCESVRVLFCFHTFHDRCIKEWVLKKTECPLCKNEIYSEKDAYIVGVEMQSYKYSETIQSNNFMKTLQRKDSTDSECAINNITDASSIQCITHTDIFPNPKSQRVDLEIDLDKVNYKRLKESIHMKRPSLPVINNIYYITNNNSPAKIVPIN